MAYKYLLNGNGNFGFLDEVYEIRILLCFLLKNSSHKLTNDQLVDICTKNDTVNYFFLTEAIDGMVRMGYATYDKDEDGNFYYSLTEKGEAIEAEFKRYIPRSLRDRFLNEIDAYFAKINRDKEVSCEYKKLDAGYEVHFVLLSENCTLADIKFFAPDLSQAKYFKKKILENPSEFYLNMISSVLTGYEEYKANENPLENIEE